MTAASSRFRELFLFLFDPIVLKVTPKLKIAKTFGRLTRGSRGKVSKSILSTHHNVTSRQSIHHNVNRAYLHNVSISNLLQKVTIQASSPPAAARLFMLVLV